MPLIDSVLNDGLSRFMDSESETFKRSLGKFPESQDEFGRFWSKAIVDYTRGLTPPPTRSEIWNSGLKTMEAALSKALSPAALPDMEMIFFEKIFNSAFQVYGASLGTLILASSPGVYSSFTPPIFLLGTQIKGSVFPIGVKGGSGKDIVNASVNVISSWVRTGTVIPTGGTPPIPWS